MGRKIVELGKALFLFVLVGFLIVEAIESIQLSSQCTEVIEKFKAVKALAETSSYDSSYEDSREISDELIPEVTPESTEDSSENSYEPIKEVSENTISEISNESTDESSEVSFEVTEESLNNSYESKEESDDSYEVIDEPSEESTETIADDEAIPYSDWDLFMLEATMYCECGAQGTSHELISANCWIARNKIVQAIEGGSSDPFREALNPNHYQGVYDNEEGWYAKCPEGVVTQELIDSNPDIHQIAVQVLNGEIPSPIYDWDCCLDYLYFGFDEGSDFAEATGIGEYIVIDDGIFFPSREWTDMCTWYCLNY